MTYAYNNYRTSRSSPPAELHLVPSRASAQRLLRGRSVGFYYIGNIGKVAFFIPRNVRVQFSTDLAHILGFSPMTKYSSNNRYLALGETRADIRSNRPYKTVYVYTNIIDPVVVGDTKVRLLRTVEASGDEVVHRVFSSPVYLPLQTKNFDSVDINITSDTGQLMPFLSGKSTVTLHFKKVTKKYLLV